MTLLEAKDVTVRFGGFIAVDRASVDVAAGERVGLIGPNGAGKSTLFAALSGFEGVGGGTVRFADEEVTRLGPVERARRGIGRTFQVPKEFSHLTVRDNLLAAVHGQAGENLARLFLAPGSVQRQERELSAKADEILAFLNLTRVAGETAIRLSGGQKKLLELGRVLMTEPKLVLLDEPFAGVNPVLIGEIAERIEELAARGVAVLVVEHNLNALSKLVTRLYAMDRGKILSEGTPAKVLSSEAVRESYMGGVA